MEAAAELLEVTNEAELEQFLGNLFKKVASGVGGFVKSSAGKALGGILKNIAKKALPIVGGALGSFVAPGVGTAIGSKLGSMASGLFEVELEGMDEQEAEFEVARRYVRLASTAARMRRRRRAPRRRRRWPGPPSCPPRASTRRAWSGAPRTSPGGRVAPRRAGGRQNRAPAAGERRARLQPGYGGYRRATSSRPATTATSPTPATSSPTAWAGTTASDGRGARRRTAAAGSGAATRS